MRDLFFEHTIYNSLAERMQKGEKLAASELYTRLAAKVFGFCMRRVAHRETAEDLMQEIFLKTVGRIETFDEKKGDFLVWFWQLARNTLTDHYRAHKEVAFSDHRTIEDHSSASRLEGPLDAKIQAEQLDVFVRSLGAEDQELFELRYLAELSYKEIVPLLHKSEGALRVSMSRIKKKVSDFFDR